PARVFARRCRGARLLAPHLGSRRAGPGRSRTRPAARRAARRIGRDAGARPRLCRRRGRGPVAVSREPVAPRPCRGGGVCDRTGVLNKRTSPFREDIAMAGETGTERIRTYCALCIARCGAIATVENGRFTRLDPDPDHPTGQALCAKGRAAPELVYHPQRLTQPLRRTRPKG